MLSLRLNPDRHMTPNAAATTNNFLDYANAIVTVQMPMYSYAVWTACRLVPVKKIHPSELLPGVTPDARPVSIGNAERRLISRAYWDEEYQDSYNKILKPLQLNANPDFGCIQGDIRKGYNAVERASLLDEIRDHDSISNTLAFSYAVMELLPYIGM